MKRLAGVLGKITTDLEKLVTEITTLQSELIFFEEQAFLWPVGQLIQRLQARGEAIIKEASRLLKEHGGRGYVGIRIDANSGIGLFSWVEDRELLADKEYFKVRGAAMFFADEMVQLIRYLIIELSKGNWDEAVTFLKNTTICIEKNGRKQPLE